VVPIFTHRDERKLFAVIGTVIVAAVIALIQLEALKAGKPSVIAVVVDSTAVFLEAGMAATTAAASNAGKALGSVPRLAAENRDLRAQNSALDRENRHLREALAAAPDQRAIAEAAAQTPGSIAAAVVGFDPENQTRVVTLDRGARAGVGREDGVLAAEGVVGRVVSVEPFSSKVLLVIDAGSKVPAIVQRGRWWGIATGTNSSISLQYVSQDAKLKIGDAVVTGRGRSFEAGLLLGRIREIYHPEGALYQTALVTPAVEFGRIQNVLVVPR
jgi:rod shape-determining protein MreC